MELQVFKVTEDVWDAEAFDKFDQMPVQMGGGE